MPVSETLIIAVLFFVGAALYASVGHGGASSYLAVMGLFSLAPDVMKPTALALNILVASVATFKFYRAGLFSWRLFWPFAVASIPAAFVGGTVMLPARSCGGVDVQVRPAANFQRDAFATAVGGDTSRTRDWISFRTDGCRGRDISESAPSLHGMG